MMNFIKNTKSIIKFIYKIKPKTRSEKNVDRIRDLIKNNTDSAVNEVKSINSPFKKSRLYLDCAKQYFVDFQLSKALSCIELALDAREENVAAYRLRASVAQMVGDINLARASVKSATLLDKLDPAMSNMLLRLGMTEDLNNYLNNINSEVFDRKFEKKSVERAAKTLILHGRNADAIEITGKYSQIKGAEPEIKILEGTALLNMRRHREAELCFASAINDPKFKEIALENIAKSHFISGDLARSKKYFDMYSEINSPKTNKFNISRFHLKLIMGDIGSAWSEYRNRPLSEALRNNTSGKYVQNLKDLSRSADIMILVEWGPGDEIRWASTYRDLEKNLSGIKMTCEPRLMSLFQRSFPSIQFIPVKRWRAEILGMEYDQRKNVRNRLLAGILNDEALAALESAECFCSISDLLADIRPTYESFPRHKGYLIPDPDLVQKWQTKIASLSHGKVKIALSWRSLLRGVRRDVHYLDVSELAPLADLDAEFWLFQTCIDEEEMEVIRRDFPNIRIADGLDLRDDFEGMAAFLKGMDFVIAPCTTTAELAGALGVPTIFFIRDTGVIWRKLPTGEDVWHSSAHIVHGENIESSYEAVIEIKNHLLQRMRIE
jgi:Flp pilus assembly protein TadD